MMKISAVNSSFVSKQNKYSPVSRGKEQVLTGKSVLKKAIVPTFALFSAALLTGCGRITNDFKKQVQEKAEKEMIETVSSSFRGDSIDNEAYKDAIEFGKAEQKNINISIKRRFDYKKSYEEYHNMLSLKLNILLKTATSPESEGGVSITLNEKATIDAVINGSAAPCSRGNNSATKEVLRQQMSSRALRNFK